MREAGALARGYFGQRVKSWEKAKGAPVTEADLAVDRMLHERLRGARPDYGWLSEETEDDGARLAHATLFVIDPIDGTVSFMKQKPEWTIAAAIVHDRRPIAACVYNPVTEEFYAAASGGGATLNGAPIRASARGELEGCRMIAPKGMLEHPSWARPWPAMHIETRGSLAYRLALVAEGKFDAMLGLSTKHDWDIAAADLIVHEAGGIATTHDGATLHYNGPQPHQPSIVAAGPMLHALLIERVRSIRL